ncbi:MAG: AMP-binding protein [Gammaproteobacteria bacterium]
MNVAEGRLISERLFDIAARDPHKELIIDPVFGRLTYHEAAEQVRRLACGLRREGFGPGDVVILQLPNWSAFIIFHIALSAIGAITGNIPFVYRQREVTSILELTGAKGLVTPREYRGFDFEAMGRTLLASDTDLSHVFVVGKSAADGDSRLVSYDSLLATPSADEIATLDSLRPNPEDVTAVGFTSGTTGNLKGAVFDTHVLNAVNKGFVDRYGLNEDDRIFGCSPLGHAVGFTHALRLTLTIGGSIVLQQHWNPGEAIAAIDKEHCTFMAAATPFLMDLVYHPSLSEHDNLPSLKVFLCGGASVPEQLVHDARINLPHTFTSPLWGMTECGGVTTCPFDAPHDKFSTTDGLPCGSMELKVVDPDDKTLPPGQDGELMARGPMVAKGYFRQPELTAEYFQSDGFFRTGDQARMDRDGYIKITGRIKDLIIRGGVNISPVEIENVLFSHPSVNNVAVVGAPDPRLGERACAFVILEKGATLELENVQRWMERAGVAKPKWPEHLEIVDALPMTISGKIQKFRLREMLARETQKRSLRVSQSQRGHR